MDCRTPVRYPTVARPELDLGLPPDFGLESLLDADSDSTVPYAHHPAVPTLSAPAPEGHSSVLGGSDADAVDSLATAAVSDPGILPGPSGAKASDGDECDNVVSCAHLTATVATSALGTENILDGSPASYTHLAAAMSAVDSLYPTVPTPEQLRALPPLLPPPVPAPLPADIPHLLEDFATEHARMCRRRGGTPSDGSSVLQAALPGLTRWTQLHEAGVSARFLQRRGIPLHWLAHLQPRFRSLYDLVVAMRLRPVYLAAEPRVLQPRFLDRVVPLPDAPDSSDARSWVLQLDAALFALYLAHKAPSRPNAATAAPATTGGVEPLHVGIARRLRTALLGGSNALPPAVLPRGKTDYVLEYRHLAAFGWDGDDLVRMGVTVEFLRRAGADSSEARAWLTRHCGVRQEHWRAMGGAAGM